jgi:hypothetical protein
LSYRLTQSGNKYASRIDDEMAFKDDYIFLESLGSKITEAMVQNIIGEWK